MKAKKSLGQNFLKSIPALNKIIETGEIAPTDIILEIGPGKGALTSRLLEKAKTVIAVEKDKELLEFLKIKFTREISSGSLVLIYDDILKFDICNCGVKNIKKYKIIANIPYNITGAILKKFLTEKKQPERMILMVQHEVAKRIVATDEKESILSISVKAYGSPKMVMKVPARYLSPAPKVDSAVISINSISRQFFKENKLEENIFWEVVKNGFAHKRKKIYGNLSKNPYVNPQKLQELRDKRPENLSTSDWVELIKLF